MNAGQSSIPLLHPALRLRPVCAACCRQQHDCRVHEQTSPQSRNTVLVADVRSSAYIENCGNGGSWRRLLRFAAATHGNGICGTTIQNQLRPNIRHFTIQTAHPKAA
jgi:hypothetical protein